MDTNKGMIYAAVGAVSLSLVLYSFFKRDQKTIGFPHVPSYIPLLGHAFGVTSDRYHFQKLLQKHPEGYSFKLAGKIFVLLSDEYSKIYTREAEGAISFDAAVIDNLLIGQTLSEITIHDPHHVRVLRKKFTPSLRLFTNGIQEETFKAFKAYGMDKDVVIIDSLKDFGMFLISHNSSRVVFGEDRHKFPNASKTFIEFHFEIVKVAKLAQLLPAFLVKVKKIKELRNVIVENTKPIVAERLKRMESPGFVSPDDYLQYLLEFEVKKTYSLTEIADFLLGLIFASMATTAISTHICMQHLTFYPECQSKIEEEIRQLESSLHEGQLTKNTLDSMKYTEGFIRECLRFCSPSLNSIRKVLEDYTFPDGKVLKQGAYICSENSYHHFNPALFEEPEKFMPERFIENKNKELSNFWHFGQGVHTCPGRFFAFHEIKMALFCFLSYYRIELADPSSKISYSHDNLEVTIDPVPVKVIKREQPLVQLNTSFT